MQFVTALDMFHPGLQEIITAFIRKGKAGNLSCVSTSGMVGSWSHYHDNIEHTYGDKFWGMTIHDKRFPNMPKVGDLSVVLKDGEYVYSLFSKRIVNSKYKKGSEEHRTKQTKDIRRMIKYVCDYIQSYSMPEVARKNVSSVETIAHRWREEYTYSHAAIVRGMNSDDFYKEVIRLRDMGIEFGVGKLAELIKDGIEQFKEFNRRQKISFNNYHCFVFSDGRVAVTKNATEYLGEFNSKETLPENLRGQMALLNMLDINVSIPEVGIKVDDNEFYLLEAVATNSNP